MGKMKGFWSKYCDSDQYCRDKGCLVAVLLVLGLVAVFYAQK